MKKYFLFISLLTAFLLAFAGDNKQYSPFASSHTGKIVCVVHSTDYPHTELEISHHISSANHAGRPQGFQSLIPANELPHKDLHENFSKEEEQPSAVFSKQYLSHIYPSHNFW